MLDIRWTNIKKWHQPENIDTWDFWGYKSGCRIMCSIHHTARSKGRVIWSFMIDPIVCAALLALTPSLMAKEKFGMPKKSGVFGISSIHWFNMLQSGSDSMML